jgi:hypothetical protein
MRKDCTGACFLDRTGPQPAFAQKAAIEAVNARWTELFNKRRLRRCRRLPLRRGPRPRSRAALDMVKGQSLRSKQCGRAWRTRSGESEAKQSSTSRDLGVAQRAEIGSFSPEDPGPGTERSLPASTSSCGRRSERNWKLATVHLDTTANSARPKRRPRRTDRGKVKINPPNREHDRHGRFRALNTPMARPKSPACCESLVYAGHADLGERRALTR